MKNNNKWFSLVIAMLLVIIISLLAITVLEYVVPFSKDIKWVENSSKAYYQANSWIEEGLYSIYERNSSWSIDDREEYSENFWWVISSSFSTNSSWTILPPPWEWNSEYDPNMYVVYSWNPVQLFIWNWYYNPSNEFKLYLRVPDLDRIPSSPETLSWWSLPIINWQLSSTSNTLNASWSIITATDINNINDNSYIDMELMQWVDLDWNETNNQKFWKFYEDNCSWIWSGCTLKLSVVNKLETNTTTSIIIPYLEWKLDLWTSIIPLRYTNLQTSWRSYWFKKDINIKIPSQTVNEAFDFTVFQ